MNLKLTGKTAIVTGATAGIGLAIAKALAMEGVTVTIPGRSRQKVDAAIREVPGSIGVLADPGTAVGCASLIDNTPTTDILVNNLGIYEAKPFAEIPDADWVRFFEVNVLSGVRLSRHYFPQMLAANNNGRVIFVSSESGVMTPPEMVHYGVTKSSQLALSRGLAELTKATTVTVNTIMPGPTRSEGIVEFLQKMASTPHSTPAQAEREFFEEHRSSSLLQRLIESEEIASLVAYLASPLSAATNGAALRAEGGLLRSIV
jgi:NAD(P)-dependent dehydrogenase (short-subunit alcohol dehydrogenase family)